MLSAASQILYFPMTFCNIVNNIYFSYVYVVVCCRDVGKTASGFTGCLETMMSQHLETAALYLTRRATFMQHQNIETLFGQCAL